mgnify:CR=1 FL=1
MMMQTAHIARNTLDIPQDVLDSARMNLHDLKVELAVSAYAQRRLGIGKARELAGMSVWPFS